MKPVSDLYGRYPESDIYVVGSGSSMRVFPVDFLRDRVTIGLNMSWRLAPVRYAVTMAPHLNVPEFIEGEEPRPEITWVTRRKKAVAVLSPEQMVYADEWFFSYEVDAPRGAAADLNEPDESGRNLEWVRAPIGNRLYQWSSISQTAVNLAANMGATNVILVGCDNSALLDNHHGHVQHTKWLGADPDRRYWQYYEGLVEVRTALRARGVNVLSLSPFLKLDRPEQDFVHLCEELDRPQHLTPGPDISATDHPSRLVRPEVYQSGRVVRVGRGLTRVVAAGSRRLRGTKEGK